MSKGYYIGLMSGTSMDALDAALVDFTTAQPTLLNGMSITLPAKLKAQLVRLTQSHDNELAQMAHADIALARLSATLVQRLLQESGLTASSVAAIGSHGQTIRHAPNASPPYTIQIGDPNTLAELSGITTVADFRRRDMAAGGQGAPLVPAFHAALYQDSYPNGVVLNLGGIANITLLPKDPNEAVSGFDTGPANTLLDAWIAQQQGKAMDSDGEWGRQGDVLPELLEAMLTDPYFKAPPPKSTGREYFHLGWLRGYLGTQPWRAQDIQATLHALAVESVARAIEGYAPWCQTLLVCGGGANNSFLMSQLRQRLGTLSVKRTDEVEPLVAGRWMEAMAFAWLARQTLLGLSGNLPAVTGARHPVILGGVYPAG